MEIKNLEKHSLQFVEEINDLTEKTKMKKNDFDILFIGSSSFRVWETMEEDLYPIKTLNHGFGGSRIYDSIYFSEKLIFDYEPKVVAIFAGTNDINGRDTKSGSEVAEITKALIQLIESRIKDVKIVYFSLTISPLKRKLKKEIIEVNEIIKDFCLNEETRTMIDFTNDFLGRKGKPIKKYFQNDKLHFNELGYELWTKISRPILLEVINNSIL